MNDLLAQALARSSRNMARVRDMRVAPTVEDVTALTALGGALPETRRRRRAERRNVLDVARSLEAIVRIAKAETNE